MGKTKSKKWAKFNQKKAEEKATSRAEANSEVTQMQEKTPDVEVEVPIAKALEPLVDTKVALMEGLFDAVKPFRMFKMPSKKQVMPFVLLFVGCFLFIGQDLVPSYFDTFATGVQDLEAPFETGSLDGMCWNNTTNCPRQLLFFPQWTPTELTSIPSRKDTETLMQQPRNSSEEIKDSFEGDVCPVTESTQCFAKISESKKPIAKDSETLMKSTNSDVVTDTGLVVFGSSTELEPVASKPTMCLEDRVSKLELAVDFLHHHYVTSKLSLTPSASQNDLSAKVDGLHRKIDALTNMVEIVIQKLKNAQCA
ncbi:hypothetical protein L596_029610 [Steinernema carpocapsae]|uniref:Uncharacterized protein n=1 Tax=Steinernema carpocapsae TaxID=34508 RepID=A0A4U5LV46_STECR|nr:hypothetical protein L596_029610 [Steinernema carpocapsae]